MRSKNMTMMSILGITDQKVGRAGGGISGSRGRRSNECWGGEKGEGEKEIRDDTRNNARWGNDATSRRHDDVRTRRRERGSGYRR